MAAIDAVSVVRAGMERVSFAPIGPPVSCFAMLVHDCANPVPGGAAPRLFGGALMIHNRIDPRDLPVILRHDEAGAVFIDLGSAAS